MIRSTKTTLKFTNLEKRNELISFITENKRTKYVQPWAPGQEQLLHFHSLLRNLEAKKDFHAKFRPSELFPRTDGWPVLSEKENGPDQLILLLTIHHRLTNASFETNFPPGPDFRDSYTKKLKKLYTKYFMDTNSIIHPEDSNNSWTFLESGFPEIDTEVAKAAPAADSVAMPPVDEDDELETAYDTTMLDCKRVAMRIARTWPDSGGMLAFNALFEPLPADKETRDWKWKLRWARRQLNNLEGIKNDTAASYAAMGHAAASIAGAGSVAAGAEAAAATHSAMGQAAASIAGAGREAAHKVRQPQLLISAQWHKTSEFQ